MPLIQGYAIPALNSHSQDNTCSTTIHIYTMENMDRSTYHSGARRYNSDIVSILFVFVQQNQAPFQH